MTRPDDELVRRYQEASAQEDARPGAHVRDAVRAHAQMLAAAAATAPSPSAHASRRAAANQSRWKLSALATVALVGLTGLLMLQFERGTPEERETAFGQRRAQTPAPAPAPAPAAVHAPEPSSTPSTPSTPSAPATPEVAPGPARDLTSPPPSTTAQKPAAVAPAPSRPLAKTAPPTPPAAAEVAPAPSKSGSLQHPDAAGALSGFPASPPISEDRATTPRPPPAPSAAAPPRAALRERSAMQDDSASSLPPPLHQASPSVTRSQPGGNRASNEAEATERPVRKALDPSLPRALRDAARVGNAREVESLIGQGVPVDGRDTAGRTALMIAALNGHTAAVQKLLALGAHTSLVDGDGLTASQHARRWGYSAIADLIDAAR